MTKGIIRSEVMSNTEGGTYNRHKRLIKKFGKKRAGELINQLEEASNQPEDMDIQGGSDESSSYERENKVKGA
jgi:hypothetical protein